MSGLTLEGLEDHEMFAVLRRKWDLRQEDVAERAGCSQPLLSAWERGRHGIPEERARDLWAALELAIRDEKTARGARDLGGVA